jgi:hypothetical protein
MVDTPFVSEDFQRAFRNQFPSQVNSGRDLHVSDVVIPVVDFTPTASGASLPNSLQFCRNKNSTRVSKAASATAQSLTSATGFVGVNVTQSGDGGDVSSAIYIDSTSFIISQINLSIGSGDSDAVTDQFVMYIPAGSSVLYDLTIASAGKFTAICTPLADVNGNLVQPSGYSPQ